MARQRLPDRRRALAATIQFHGREYAISFGISIVGFNRAMCISECFCSPSETVKTGADDQAIVADACIAISKLLQHGESIQEVADSFCEDRPMGASNGPPSSLIGAVARIGAKLEEELAKQ